VKLSPSQPESRCADWVCTQGVLPCEQGAGLHSHSPSARPRVGVSVPEDVPVSSLATELLTVAVWLPLAPGEPVCRAGRQL